MGELQDINRTHMSTCHVLGSPGYIDPLFIETLQYAQRTDNYALGITLLVCFTGKVVSIPLMSVHPDNNECPSHK